MMKRYLLLYMGLFFAYLYPLEAHADTTPDVIRYEKLETLVRTNSPQMQMEQAQYDSRLMRYENIKEEIMKTKRLLREEAEDLEESGDEDSAGQYRAQAKTLEDMAKDMSKQIRPAQGSQTSMSLRRMEGTVLWIAQNPMGIYNTPKTEQEAALARAERKQSQYEELLRRVQTGSISTAQADRTGRETDAATAETKAVQDEMEQMKKELFILTGIPEGSQAEVGPMPAPRPERVLEMRDNTDKWCMLDNNYSLGEQGSGGVNSNKELHACQRNIRQSEEAVHGQLDTLYQDALVSQTLWINTVASMAFQGAASQAASNRLALGVLPRQEHLEAKVTYMDAVAVKERADIGFQQAVDTYDWALKGLVT